MSTPGSIITLTQDTLSNGISVVEGTDVTVDLNGKVLTLNGELAGSAGTKTQAFQLLKNSNVCFKNGTITSDDAKMIIQNYSNLTLDNVKVIGGTKAQYVVSNNFGNTVFKNGTEIHATEGNIAFDVYYGLSAAYDDGVSVTIEDNSVVIDGPIEYGRNTRRAATAAEFLNKAHLIKPESYSLNAPSGYDWQPIDTQPGFVELRPNE